MRKTATILDDTILEAYNHSIESYNERAKRTLGGFGRSNGKLTGSSPFMLVHLANCGLLQKGVKLTTRKDLEGVISSNNTFLKENYTDFGLVLATAEDSYEPNKLLAKRLSKQLGKRGVHLDRRKLISFAALKLREDKNSAYGLVFDLNDQIEDNFIANLDDFKWDYKRKEGLASASLGRKRCWDGANVHLSMSGFLGRVIVISETK